MAVLSLVIHYLQNFFVYCRYFVNCDLWYQVRLIFWELSVKCMFFFVFLDFINIGLHLYPSLQIKNGDTLGLLLSWVLRMASGI